MGSFDMCLPMPETHCLCSLKKGRVRKTGIGIKNSTRDYGRKKATVVPVLARNLCICTCILMINEKFSQVKNTYFY